MTTNVSKATLKKMTTQEFEAVYNKVTAGMGEYEKLLLLRELTASVGALVKDQVKAELKRRRP